MSKQILSGFFDNRRSNQRDGQLRGRLAGTSARSRLTAIATGALLFGTVLCGGGVAAESFDEFYYENAEDGGIPAGPNGECRDEDSSSGNGSFFQRVYRDIGGRCYPGTEHWGGEFLPGVLSSQGYGVHGQEGILSWRYEYLPDAKLIKIPYKAPPYRITTRKGAVINTFYRRMDVDFIDVDCGTADYPWYRPGFDKSFEVVRELVVCPDDSKAPTVDELLERGRWLKGEVSKILGRDEFISNKRIAPLEVRNTTCRPHPNYNACRAKQSLQPVCENEIRVPRRTPEEACADPRLEGEKAPAGGPE